MTGLMEADGGIIDSYRRRDLLLFLPDRDGRDLSADFTRLEARAQAAGARLICCAAYEEVETWLLAGHIDKLGKAWSEVRADTSVKEAYFQDFLANHGDAMRASGGRDLLMATTLQNYSGLKQRCPELQSLEERISAVIESRI